MTPEEAAVPRLGTDEDASHLSSARPLLAVDGRPFLLLDKDVRQAAVATWEWQQAGLTVRVVRGRKMRTEHGVFDEFTAALQFPWYFGEMRPRLTPEPWFASSVKARHSTRSRLWTSIR